MATNRVLALAFGGIYLLIGVSGMTITGDIGLVEPDGSLLLGIFEVNPLHNAVHLLIGGALVAGALTGLSGARIVTASSA